MKGSLTHRRKIEADVLSEQSSKWLIGDQTSEDAALQVPSIHKLNDSVSLFVVVFFMVLNSSVVQQSLGKMIQLQHGLCSPVSSTPSLKPEEPRAGPWV